jgi:hypothetical protein
MVDDEGHDGAPVLVHDVLVQWWRSIRSSDDADECLPTHARKNDVTALTSDLVKLAVIAVLEQRIERVG